MPQPLSRVNPRASVIIGNAGHRALSERPALAVLAMEAIGSFSNVESFLLRLFVRLFGGNSTLAARIYLALDGRGPKSAALNEAIAHMDDPRLAELTRAIIAISKSNQKERDKLAHNVWGISPDLPHALLLLDPKTQLNNERLDYDDVYVYTAEDFRRIIHANDRVCGFGLKLQFILDGHPANKDNRLYDELCNESEIRERLNPRA